MSVLYDDYENTRRYYVKIDNVSVPDNLKGYKAINATTPSDLLNKVMQYYKLDANPNIKTELWSTEKPYKGIRLDNLKEIPKEYEFIWARIRVVPQ